MTRAEKLRAKIAPFADAIVITDVLNQYYISASASPTATSS